MGPVHLCQVRVAGQGVDQAPSGLAEAEAPGPAPSRMLCQFQKFVRYRQAIPRDGLFNLGSGDAAQWKKPGLDSTSGCDSTSLSQVPDLKLGHFSIYMRYLE